MAIIQGMCTSFKVGLLNGQFDFGVGTTQTYKIALYTSLAILNSNTTAYSPLYEVVAAGYTAGGEPLTISTPPTSSGTVAYLNFADAVWTSSEILARGALIYLANGVDNPAVAVLDFGADKTSTGPEFRVQFPTVSSTTAILRIA